ncbi:MAG: Uma2 family endonuclease [Acidobacteria bacterium]|nr:Uma2 family endonuclease [Acidobacteriota bacterium]
MPLVLHNLGQYAQVLLRGPVLTDDEFLEFCREHEDLRVESNAEGALEIMPQPGPETGITNNDIAGDLRAWARADGRGRAMGSSALFRLANGARRSPDAAWVEKSRIPQRAIEGRSRPWELCPDFVVEIRSTTDRVSILHQKMLEWMDNGALLGWLVDPLEHTVTIYRPGQQPELLREPQSLPGEGPVAGFVLDLAPIWADWTIE